MATEKPADFRFDYKKRQSKHLTIEKLDAAFDSFAAPATNTLSQIMWAIRLTAFAAYCWTRWRLIDEEMLIEKQEYEMRRTQSNSGDLTQDDLD